MALKEAKLLIETSCVRAVLGDSTADHVRHVSEEIADSRLYSSTYLRMEFIRRWVCDAARVAFTIDQCRDVGEALYILEQDFSPRNMKGNLAVLAKFLRSRGLMKNSRAAAEDIASQAVKWLRQFDSVFGSRIQNKCHCKIGSKSPEIDFNHLLSDLRTFYLAFLTPVTDSEVNAFLQLSNKRSAASLLMDGAKSSKLDAVKNLIELREAVTHITCKECTRIGDAVIALEQPPSWCLVHLDNSFNELCSVLGRKHKQVKSVLRIAKETSTSAAINPPAV